VRALEGERKKEVGESNLVKVRGENPFK